VSSKVQIFWEIRVVTRNYSHLTKQIQFTILCCQRNSQIYFLKLIMKKTLLVLCVVRLAGYLGEIVTKKNTNSDFSFLDSDGLWLQAQRHRSNCRRRGLGLTRDHGSHLLPRWTPPPQTTWISKRLTVSSSISVQTNKQTHKQKIKNVFLF
jgi:hypothetical protein